MAQAVSASASLAGNSLPADLDWEWKTELNKLDELKLTVENSSSNRSLLDNNLYGRVVFSHGGTDFFEGYIDEIEYLPDGNEIQVSCREAVTFDIGGFLMRKYWKDGFEDETDDAGLPGRWEEKSSTGSVSYKVTTGYQYEGDQSFGIETFTNTLEAEVRPEPHPLAEYQPVSEFEVEVAMYITGWGGSSNQEQYVKVQGDSGNVCIVGMYGGDLQYYDGSSWVTISTTPGLDEWVWFKIFNIDTGAGTIDVDWETSTASGSASNLSNAVINTPTNGIDETVVYSYNTDGYIDSFKHLVAANAQETNDPLRVQYDNVAADTVLRELLMYTGYGVGSCPATNISLRIDYESKLTSVKGVAEAVPYTDTDGVQHDADWEADYTNDEVNISQPLGIDQGAIDVLLTSSMSRRLDNRLTGVEGVGYGDGRHQVKADAYDADNSLTHRREIVLHDRRFKHQNSLQDKVDTALSEGETEPREIPLDVLASDWFDTYGLSVGDTVDLTRPKLGLNDTKMRIVSATVDRVDVSMEVSTQVTELTSIQEAVRRSTRLQDTGMQGDSDTNQDTHVDSIEGSSDGTYANAKPWVYDLLIPSDANLTGAADLGATIVELSFRLRDFRSYTSLLDADNNLATKLDFSHRHIIGELNTTGFSGFLGHNQNPSFVTFDEDPNDYPVYMSNVAFDFVEEGQEGVFDTTEAFYLIYDTFSGDWTSNFPVQWHTQKAGTEYTVTQGLYEEAYSSPSVWIRIDDTDYGSDGAGGLTERVKELGTATGGTSTTLEDTSKSWSTDQWNNYEVIIVAGTGKGQTRTISDTTTDTLTVSSSWDKVPSTDSDYEIFEVNEAFTGDQTGLDITSLIGSPGTWSTIEIWDDQSGVLGRVQGTIFTQYFLESS